MIITAHSFRHFIFCSLAGWLVLKAINNEVALPVVGSTALVIKKPFADSLPRKKNKTVTRNNPGLIQNRAGLPDSIVAFAKTLIGVPYLYASTDPKKGFDCSGFITYVFNHFNVTVPRSSVSFTNYGKEVSLANARPGDLILFTGTDSTVRVVGHMGIVERVQGDSLYFIHSSSGKANGVVITLLGKYYKGRFVKLIRLFADNSYR